VSAEKPAERSILRHWQASALPASGAWAQKRRLASAMRLVIERLVRSDAPEDELSIAADRLEGYAERLATHPRLTRYEGFAETANAGDTGAFFDQSPLIGLANPLAPPIAIRATGERSAEGCVTFGSAYEGPPGCVHGGFIAAAFDEVLGFTQSLTGSPGFTGTASPRRCTPSSASTARSSGRSGARSSPGPASTPAISSPPKRTASSSRPTAKRRDAEL
jgi:hypothetical protein